MLLTNPTNHSLKYKVLHSLKWVGSVTFLVQLISWAITIYVIRILSPADFGLMGIALVFLGTLSMVSELGLGFAIIQKENITSEQLKQVFGFVIIGNVFFFLILFFGAPFISRFYQENRLTPILMTLSFIFLLRPLYVIHEALLMKEMNFKSKSIIDLVANLSAAGMALILAVMGFGVWALIWNQIMLYSVRVVGFNVARKSFIIPSFKFKGSRDLLSFGGFATGTTFFRGIFFKADILIGGKFLSSTVLGFYAVAVQLSSIILDKLSLVIPQVAFSAFSSIQSDHTRLSSNFMNGLRLLNLISLPCFIGIAAIAPELVSFFLGDKWTNVIVPMQLICLIMPLRMFDVLFYPAISGIGRADLCMAVSVFATILLSPAFLIGIRWGVIGLCWAWLIAYPIVFFVMLIICQRQLHLGIANILKTSIHPLVASIAMTIVIFLLKSMTRPSMLPIFHLMFFVFAGMLTFAATLLLMNRHIFQELRDTFLSPSLQ